MGWLMWDMKSTSVCIMVRMNLPEVIVTSMALNHSGRMRNEDLKNSMVFHMEPFICTSKNVNLDSIIERKIFML